MFFWGFLRLTQYVRNLIPLGPPLQDACEVGTDADMADVVQEHPYNSASQMCQKRHRYKLTELKEEKIRDVIDCTY